MVRFFVFILINIVLSCSVSVFGRALTDRDTAAESCRETAGRQLDEVLLIMQKHYYKKNNVNWDSLIIAAKTRLLNAGSCADALQTVNWCFNQLQESHNYIMPAARAAVYNNDTSQLKQPVWIGQLVGEIKTEMYADHGIAYISIPWVSTTDPVICTRIADSLQRLIAGMDGSGISKWIIDLRKNTGGNCWPMIAGLGPLLGEGICGYFVAAGDKVPIIYRDGASMQGRHIRCKVSGTPYKSRVEKKNIIVLTGSKTSSSGEIVTLAFKGKEGAVQYGGPTAGFTTANSSYTLSDKSMLVLTVSMEADRTGKIYNGPIVPDEFIITDPENGTEDRVKSAAIMWLHIL